MLDTHEQAGWNGANTASTEPLPRVCLVGPLPPPSGGMANQCEQLIRLFTASGLDIELVQTNAPYCPAWMGRVPVVRALARLIPYLFKLWGAIGRKDVVHVMANSGWSWYLFASPAIWIARIRAKPVIVNYRGGNAARFFDAAAPIARKTLELADVCVTPSAFLQRVFEARGLQSRIVPNTVDLTRFSPSGRDLGARSPHVIVTRNLEPIYDIPTAICAFALVRAQIPAASLTVAGSGPLLSSLKALVHELGLSGCVTFSGRIDNADIPALYASADCLVNASTVDNMPISILEAFASGVPVVSTRAGGIPDMLEHNKTGLLVPVGDVQAMANAILRVLEDVPLASALRVSALEEVSRYAWPSVRANWLSVYRAATQGQEKAGSTERCGNA